MADNENDKKRRRVTISVDDMYNVFHRYTEPTIITLYQEIANLCGEKIDWNELVKRTSTGIKNAREYQMLWRHLAFRHPLEERTEDGAEPLDDESDLETDLEAAPLGSAKTVADAQACVKVLLACGPPSDSSMLSRATVSLAANEKLASAVLKSSHPAVSRPGTNSSLQISSQKQSSYAHPSSNVPVATGVSPLSKKKKNMWSPEDDSVLIAGVKKCGAGNWAIISREHFKGERSATQVGSRWKQLKDKIYSCSSAGSNVNGQQLSNGQVAIATRNALSMALNMPVTLTASSVGSGSSSASVQTITYAPLKDRSLLTKAPVLVKSSICSNSMLQATAMAAGARIATPETAELILKAAHANNAVHIMQGGGPVIKSGSLSSLPSSHLVAPHHGGAGLATTTLSDSLVVPPNHPIINPQSNAISSTAADKPPSSPST